MYLIRLFRRSPLPVGTLLASGASLFLVMGRDTSWVGIWPRGSAAAQQCSFYLAAMFAAIQATFVATDRRARMTGDEFPASRSPLSRAATRLCLGLLSSLVAYTVPFVVVLVENLRNGSPDGGLWWSYYLLGIPVMAIGVSSGQVFGTLLKSDYIAPIVAAVVSFIVIATVGQMVHLVAMSGDAWYDVSPAGLAARCLLGISLLFASLCISQLAHSGAGSWRRGSSSIMKTVVACAVVVGVGVGATVVNPQVQVARPQPKKQICTGINPRICLWPDDAKYLAEAKQMSQGMQTLPSRFKVPPQFSETGLSRPRSASELPTSEGRLWNAANGMAIDIGSASYPSDCVPDGTDAQNKFSEANFNILGFLLRSIYGPSKPSNEGGGPPVDDGAIEYVVKASLTERNSWIDAQERYIYAPPCVRK